MVKAYFWRGHRNFGDLLTPLLLKELANIEVEWAAPKEAELIAVGSIATHIPRGWDGIVFGTGKPRQNERIDLSKATVLALRGQLTAAGSGARPGYILGDPGLLVSMLDGIKVSEEIPVGLVAHWEDRNLGKRWKGELIDVEGDPLEVIRQIAACKRVVSSSLHGIIVADAFGKERRWERSARATPFKFADYGTVVGRFLPGHWDQVRPHILKQTQANLSGALGRLHDLLADRWSEVPNLWAERLAALAAQVPNGSTVLDLGAGSQGLREALHPSCRYTPADLAQRTPDSLPFDMERGIYPDGRWDVVVASGVLEYATRPLEVLSATRRLAPTVLLTYEPLRGRITRNRVRSGWHNHLTRSNLERMFGKAGFRSKQIGEWQRQSIYRLVAA